MSNRFMRLIVGVDRITERKDRPVWATGSSNPVKVVCVCTLECGHTVRRRQNKINAGYKHTICEYCESGESQSD
jgi:hypothetical protein